MLEVLSLRAALMFLSSSESGIVLQCDSTDSIPYVKREIIRILGEPSKQLRTTLFYGDKHISVVPTHDEASMRGYSWGALFYVGVKDIYESGTSTGLTMWREAGLCESDVYTLLVREGYTSDKALWLMAQEGIVNYSV